MKRLTVGVVAVLAMMLGGAALAGQSSVGEARQSTLFKADGHVLPVLVAVDQAGKVTKVDTPISLSSAQQNNLKQVVSGMIKGPAKDKSGRAHASQLVMMFAINHSTDGSGNYALKYLRSKSEPVGEYHWVTVKTGSDVKYALSRSRSNSNVAQSKQSLHRAMMQPLPRNSSGK